MSDQEPLSPTQREQFARELTNEQLEIAPSVSHPTAIFTAGQPGSGKSSIVSNMRLKFQSIGTAAVEIDPDEIRPQLPYMQPRIAKGDLEIPGAAYVDAGTIGSRVMEMAADAKRNIIYDGTLSSPKYARQNISYLKELDYRVEVHSMAVAPDLSHATTYARREGQIARSSTGFGRGVGDEFHDQAVDGLVKTLDALQSDGVVDAIVLYDRQGNIVGRTQREGERWVPDEKMAEVLKAAHQNPTERALRDAAQTWDDASTLMRSRGADSQEQIKVDGFRDDAQIRVAKLDQGKQSAEKFEAACAQEAKSIINRAAGLERKLQDKLTSLENESASIVASKPSGPAWMPGAGKASAAWQVRQEANHQGTATVIARLDRVAPYTQAPIPGYPSKVEEMAVKKVERREPQMAKEAMAFRATERQQQARAFSEARLQQQANGQKLSR